MESIKFKGTNIKIAEGQEEYETIHARVYDHESGFLAVEMCFQLDPIEWEQMAKTGHIWLTILQPQYSRFHPMLLSTRKPVDIPEDYMI